MSEYVFILGAGASKHAGAPLMVEFLDRARELYAAHPKDEFADDLRTTFEAISKLQAVHSKSEMDIVNLESVFSAFDMADLLGVSPSCPNLLRSMRRLIAWTLDRCVTFGASSHMVHPTLPYSVFAGIIRSISPLGQEQRVPRCSVITFNYDVCVDLALHAAGIDPDYGLMPDRAGSLGLYKLHGSTNWGRCSQDGCGAITAAKFAVPPNPNQVQRQDPKSGYMVMGLGTLKDQGLERCAQCGQNLDGECFIVPPTWDKSTYRSNLSNVWRRAAAELADATDIIVCGYSMPETDSFFRYLYALGSVGPAILRRFWVFDPSDQVHARFRGLLGPGAGARFEARRWTFEYAVGMMKERVSGTELLSLLPEMR